MAEQAALALPRRSAAHDLDRWHVAGALGGLGALAVVLATFLPEQPLPWLAWDSRTYWDAARAADPYADAEVGTIGAYLYSPAFLQVLRPVAMLPWPAFLFGWAAATVAVAWALLSGRSLGARWLVPLGLLALLDVWAGNINVFLAGTVVVGLRWPAAWSFVALTKVSPGLGIVWFVARREWRNLAIAVAATAGVALVSAAFDPHAWTDWFSVLLASNAVTELNGDLAIPALVRFPVALALTWWGARTDRAWLVPIAVVLLLPVIWPNGLAILVGCAALVRAGARTGVPAHAPAGAGLAAAHPR